MAVLDTIGDRYALLPPWFQTLVDISLTLLVGVLIIKVLRRYFLGLLERAHVIDRTLRGFIGKLVTTGGWIVLFVVVFTVNLDVDLAALLGGLAIGGFVIGFALKDTLGNLAAGVMLLLYRPFDVGDTVTIDGQDGDVATLGVALTTLRAADGRIITVPNGTVLGGTVINHTRAALRRADVLVGIGYDDDIDQAIRAILEAVQADPRVLSDPAPSVRITGLGASSVDLQVRPWVKTSDYWQAKAELNATIKQALEATGCSIPYPQQVVHHVGSPS